MIICLKTSFPWLVSKDRPLLHSFLVLEALHSVFLQVVISPPFCGQQKEKWFRMEEAVRKRRSEEMKRSEKEERIGEGILGKKKEHSIWERNKPPNERRNELCTFIRMKIRSYLFCGVTISLADLNKETGNSWAYYVTILLQSMNIHTSSSLLCL